MTIEDIDWNSLSDDALRRLIHSYDPKPVFAKFHHLVQRHLTDQAGLFGEMRYDPADHHHDLATVSYPPQLTTFQEVRDLSGIATPNRDRVIRPALLQDEGRLNELYNRVYHDGKPMSLLMAHDDITDIGRILPEVMIVLCEYHADLEIGSGWRGEPTWERAAEQAYRNLAQKFHVVLSGIIRVVDALGFSVADLLAKVTWVHFSFPQTESVREAEFDPILVKATNQLMRRELQQLLDSDGGLLGIAGPGSVDKRIPLAGLVKFMAHMPQPFASHFSEMRHIQPIHHGTAALLRGHYVLPVAAKTHGADAFLETGRIQKVNTLADLHTVMHGIAETCFRRTLMPTAYHEDADSLRRVARFRRGSRDDE